MSQKRVTIQQIADACRLSRNTVSKVFNQRGSVPETTRQYVLAKAAELGYFSRTLPQTPPASMGTVAVLSCSNPLNHHFGSMLMKSFTDTICRWGYSVRMYELSAAELAERRLPEQLDPDSVAGLLCIELFDRDFLTALSATGLPMVSVDAYCDANRSRFPCDIVTMENVSSVMQLTRQLLQAGAERLGFVGDMLHCNSFHERWGGFCAALRDAGLQPEPALCILARDGSHYADPDWTEAQLARMPRLPDAFVCANDYHAVKLMQALKHMGRSIPGDVMVTGFDNSPESAVIEPALTTVHIPSSEMGVQAAELLLRRIQSPERPRVLVYVQTVPVFRGSSRAGQSAEAAAQRPSF